VSAGVGVGDHRDHDTLARSQRVKSGELRTSYRHPGAELAVERVDAT
jgi:hypothetical protein